MNEKNKVVLGIFKTRQEVEKTIEALKNLGFKTSDMSALMPELSGSQEFGHTKSSKAPEGAATGGAATGGAATGGAATGASAGLVLGGTLGLLAGIGALAIPGIGPFIAAGPIMGALAGVGVGGTIGGVTGALIGLGLPEYEAKRYEGSLKNGGILLSVHTNNVEEVSRAKECLIHCGAEDVSSSGEIKGQWTHLTPQMGINNNDITKNIN